MNAGGEGAHRGSGDQAEHGDAESRAAVESIEEERAGQTGDGRGRGVAAADQAELGGGDAEGGREVGAHRHDHDEIEDVDELHRRDQQDDGAFALFRCSHGGPLDAGRGVPGSEGPV